MDEGVLLQNILHYQQRIVDLEAKHSSCSVCSSAGLLRMQSPSSVATGAEETQREDPESSLDTESFLSTCIQNASARQSLGSESSLSSQSTTLPERAAPILNAVPHTPVTYEEIQAKEQDLPSLFSKDELLLCDDSVTHREQIERSFLLNVVNKNDLPPRLDDPAPFLHSSADSIPIPEVKRVDCRLVDKNRLREREQVMEALHRPYHPLLYSSLPSHSSVCSSYETE